jgi:hypothetical protein
VEVLSKWCAAKNHCCTRVPRGQGFTGTDQALIPP